MIPKIIHYCWFGGNEIPGTLKKFMKSWREFCPEYEIKRWDESNYDIHRHPFVKAAYEAKAWAFVSDYVRLDVVYRYGGVYLDTDVELLKNLDFLLENECYIGIQQDGCLCTTGLGFGAEKHNYVVREMLAQYDSIQYDNKNKKTFACPVLNDSVVRSVGTVDSRKICSLKGITVYPAQYFDPISPGNTEKLFCNETVSVHHYAATWTSGISKWKRKIIIMLGEDKYHKMKKKFGRAR